MHRYYTPAANAALAAHDPQTCGIVLAHSPEMAGEAAAAGHALYLCGHCHGGQVCLPGGRPLITHLSRHRDLYGGLWRHGDMSGYTSTGAGLSDPPVRFNCRGEVTEFRLRAAPTEAGAGAGGPAASALIDHAAGDARPAAAERLGLIAEIVAAGMDHERAPARVGHA